MDYPAAPRPGRRVSLGSLVVLAGFLLLAPPLFLLAPFVLLTLFSRPQSLRELFWLVAAGVGAGLAVQGPPGLASLLIRASGIVAAVCFLILSLRSTTPFLGRGLGAVFVTGIALVGWQWTHGTTWPEVEMAFTSMLREGYQSLLPPPGSGQTASPELKSFIQPFIDAAPQLARAMPGLLALEGLAGLSLAWHWHHRIAVRPLGVAPGPFRGFRFNDQLIWGAIFTLALLVISLPPEAAVVAENLLILWVGLYAVRGLAILATLLGPAPLPLRILLVVLGLVLSPLSLGLCLALGLADTWLDIRGRLAPSVPGGSAS